MPNPYTKNLRAYLQADRIGPFLNRTQQASDADSARYCDAFSKLSACDQKAIRAENVKREREETALRHAEYRANPDAADKLLDDVFGIKD